MLVGAVVVRRHRLLNGARGWQRPLQNLYRALHASLVVARYEASHLQSGRFGESHHQIALLAGPQFNGDPRPVGVGIVGAALFHVLGMLGNFIFGPQDQFVRDFAVIEHLQAQGFARSHLDAVRSKAHLVVHADFQGAIYF